MLVLHPKYLSADGAAAPGLDMPHLDGLAGFTHGNGLALLLNYDADGRLTGMNTADGLTEVQDLTLAYDGVGRLTWASGAYGEIDYTYDLVGNRTHRTIDDGTITDEAYAYGAGSHRLESVTVGSPTRDFAYTAAGSTASDSRAGTPLAFAYNFAGRLEAVTATSGTLASREYSYDALQHRVREVKEDRGGGEIQTSAVSYVYDLDGHLIAEAATLGLTPSVRREYIWLGDTPVGVVDHTTSGDPLLAIHTDHLGRPQKLTDASQAVVWDGQFDPFGEEHAVAGTTDLPLRFPGQEWDAATGLSQNWNRDYDPTIGRYIESDPIGLAGGINTYSYAGNHPIGGSDPTGLTMIGGIARAGAAAMAACMRVKTCKQAVKRALDMCKNIECKFERHPGHHLFPGLGWCEHYSLTCWEKGIGRIFRSQWPLPGRCDDRKPKGPLPSFLSSEGN